MLLHRGTEWNVVHRSEKIKNSLNPKWKEEEIELSVLCGGNVDLPLRLAIFDYESSGKHVPMGGTFFYQQYLFFIITTALLTP